MTSPLWLRRFLRLLVWVGDLEEELIDPLCPDCVECVPIRRRRKVTP